MKVFFSIISFLTLFTTTQALASSHYEQLRNLFAQSHASSQSELNGWWSGRCFRPQNPDFAFGAVIVGRQIEVQHGNPNDGPLFPPSTEKIHQYNVFGRGYQGAEAPADHFDNLDIEKVNFIDNLINAGQLNNSIIANDSLKADFRQGNINLATRTYMNSTPDSAEKYFITQLKVIAARPPYLSGDDFAICYFFKQVR